MMNVREGTIYEQRVALTAAGFVHVTGLTATGSDGTKYEIIVEDENFGRWDQRGGKLVVVTTGGEIWLAAGFSVKAIKLIEGMVGKVLCPNGRGSCVPCLNGENIATSNILQRLADPDWEPR